MAILRSAFFNLLMFSSVMVYAVAALFTFPLPPLKRYAFIKHWARLQVWLLTVVCGMGYRVEGREHLPPGPAIILANHQSSWETLAFQDIFPPQVWVLKKELLRIPFFGWGLAMTQPIAIDRGARMKAMDQVVEQGRQRLAGGRWVVVFPEGTRLKPGEKRRWGIGGAVLASRTGYPVVPVAHNAGSFWPRRGFIKRPGTITVAIGPAIDSRGKTPEEILAAAQGWVESALARLESQPPPGR
jgi:1-acyl-sn-glycerol-3-phosphate acyltransferase